MDEIAIKGLEPNESIWDLRRRCDKILVEGYDTSLPVNCVRNALREHFSSCGEIVSVNILYDVHGTLNSGILYILGDGAEEKALKLSGSEMLGRKLVATSAAHRFPKPTPKMAARLANADRKLRSKMIHVSGYDTSLRPDDIKSALINHFSSCGEILDFVLFREEDTPVNDPKFMAPIPFTNNALLFILGEDAEEKAVQLNGSDMGGRKLFVAPSFIPSKESTPFECPVGYTIPARFANPKKKQNKKKKTGLNRKKTRK
ncbi:hypothetical protein EUTSA_v10021355mg [Eutrema salsugineum]|uniref:RRM domain-containing protein n=1 Tax=Eutrema salsugineum TaxID=72664 RepID=V4M703_EUTSA|nr:hypothetical protein EUTSA_v10021355mg [Eutrema salsugineum]